MAAAAAHMGRAEEHAPADARHGLRLARRVIIKVGTPVATHCDGSIALGRLGSLVEQISRLRQEGRDVVVVTSGAISTGSLRMRRNMTLQRSLQHSIQQKEESVPAAAAASVGQALLVNMYETMFSKYNLSCAQVLITEDDMADSETFSQMCDTTMELLQLGCIPIINDNDAVTARTTPVYNEETSEVVWDNDVLASRLAIGLRADLLITLTDVDSLYSAPSSVSASLSDDPDADPVRIPVYHPDVTLVTRSPKVSNWTLLSDNGRGTFAGRTRMSEACLKAIVEACTSAVASGVRAAVVHTGHHPLSLLHILRGDDVGTLFIQKGAAMTSKL